MDIAFLRIVETLKRALNIMEEPERSPLDLPKDGDAQSWSMNLVRSILHDGTVSADVKAKVNALNELSPRDDQIEDSLIAISSEMQHPCTRSAMLPRDAEYEECQIIRPALYNVEDAYPQAFQEAGNHRQILLASIQSSPFASRNYVQKMQELLDLHNRAGPEQPTLVAIQPELLNPAAEERIKLDIVDAGLNDEQILKLSRDPLQITSLDVQGNKLSDSFVTRIVGRIDKEITRINFASNPDLTSEIIPCISDLATSLKLTKLKTLSLAGVRMTGVRLTQLTSNLNASSTPSLESLDLSCTDLGKNDDVGSESLSFAILQLRKLKKLSLDGNFLRVSHLNKIGDALTEMDILEELNISDNSPSHDASGALAMDSLMSMMGSIASLKVLHVRNNQLNDKSVFVLADSLSQHLNITDIDLSDNPALGYFGTLAILKLIVFNDFPAQKKIASVKLNNSCATSTGSIISDFNFSDPSGHYGLDLTCPFNRAVARQCLRHWELIDPANAHSAWYMQSLEDTFFELRYNGEKFRPEKDIEAIWIIPKSGFLSYTCIYKLCMPEYLHSADKFFVRNTCNSVAHPISDLKRVNDRMVECFIQGIYSNITNTDHTSLLIDCVSTFFMFEWSQVDMLLQNTKTKSLQRRIASKLIPRKTMGVLSLVSRYHKLLSTCYPKKVEETTQGMSATEMFVGDNVSGRYVLDLSNPADRHVAEWIIQIDRFEVEILKSRAIPTNITSFSNIRNCTMNGKQFNFYPDWVLPSIGSWCFDFISPNRFPHSYTDPKLPRALSEEVWVKFVDSFYQLLKELPSNNTSAFVAALRQLTRHKFFIDCNQLCTLLKICDQRLDLKLDIVSIFLRRIIDYPELKEMLCRPRLGLDPLIGVDQVPKLEERIGRMALINPLKIDNTSFECNLATVEGRLVAGMVLRVHSKEKGSRLVNSRIGETLDNAVVMDPPKSWQTSLPRSGYWCMTYVASGEASGGDKALRKQMALTVCGFDQRTFNTV